MVEFRGWLFYLTRLGFRLNCAPRIMTVVLKRVFGLEESIRDGTDSYIDDILVDQKIINVGQVVQHLASYGLLTKSPEPVKDSRVLGLQISKDFGELHWR